jgi:hypothetical protein
VFVGGRGDKGVEIVVGGKFDEGGKDGEEVSVSEVVFDFGGCE